MGRERGTLAHTQPAAAAQDRLGPEAGAAAAASSSGAASAGSRLSSRGSGRERGGAGRRSGRGRRESGASSRHAGAGLPELGARFRISERSRRGSRSPCQRRPPAARAPASRAAALQRLSPRPPLTPPFSPEPRASLSSPARSSAPANQPRREPPGAAGPDLLPPPAGAHRPLGLESCRRGGGGEIGNHRPLLAGSLGGAPGHPVKDAIVAAERIGPRGGFFLPFCWGGTAPLPFVSGSRCPALSAVRLRPG
ncbi:uncharacterized protein RBU33_004224 [Hipposideros larvatus]